jgi:hypothetical protein
MIFQEVFLGISVLLMLVLLNHKVESSKKLFNIALMVTIILTMVLYLL